MIEPIEFACPACLGELFHHPNSYECEACARLFPVIAGIPDFRLRSDRYLSLEEERAKAEKLHAAAQTKSFDELLKYYYAITDDVTPENAARYARYALGGSIRARLALDDFGNSIPGNRLLDIGCGSGGGLLAAKDRFASTVGLDIALRWLVIAKKQLEESGITATLVCADLESPPFKYGQFSHILALDVFDHVYDIDAGLTAMRRQLRAGGRLWLSGTNKRWLGPHPSTGIWAAGYRSVKSRSIGSGSKAYDPLRFVTWLTPGTMRRACAHAGLDVLDIRPSRIASGARRGYLMLMARAYAYFRRSALTKRVLVAVGPYFQLTAQAPEVR